MSSWRRQLVLLRPRSLLSNATTLNELTTTIFNRKRCAQWLNSPPENAIAVPPPKVVAPPPGDAVPSKWLRLDGPHCIFGQLIT